MSVRKLLLIFGLTGLLVIVVTNFDLFSQFGRLFRDARWYLAPLVILMQGLSYFGIAMYYKSFFLLMGYKLGLAKLYKSTLAVNFVNQAVPSIGISGTSYLSLSVEDEVPKGMATLAQLMRYGFTFITFLVVLTFGFLILYFSGPVQKVSVRVILLLMLAIVSLVLIAWPLINDRTRIAAVASAITRLLNQLFRFFGRKTALVTSSQSEHFLDEFYHGYSQLVSRKWQWRRPMAYTLLSNLAEVATLYGVFVAFGEVLNPGVIIAAYALANIVGLAGLLTGGIGVYEATMVAALVALGMPLAVAVAGTVLYRVLVMAASLPIGFYFYRRQL